MKNGDTVRKDAIQMARAAVLQVEKDKVTLDDEGVMDVIAKEVKKGISFPNTRKAEDRI